MFMREVGTQIELDLSLDLFFRLESLLFRLHYTSNNSYDNDDDYKLDRVCCIGGHILRPSWEQSISYFRMCFQV